MAWGQIAAGARAERPAEVVDGGRFPRSLLYAAAKMYYEEDTTQADVAARLGLSRPTVSRMLSEARRQGIVRIDVVSPGEDVDHELADRLAEALGLQRVYLSEPLPAALPSPAPGRPSEHVRGLVLAPAVGRALSAVGLAAGDVLLVSSGRTVYEVAQHDLAWLPGVVVAPTLGGADQPESWYQTNEIVRLISSRVGGRATYLFAPALPGPQLYETLRHDPAIQRVLHLWPRARCVLASVGAPPTLRLEVPQFLPAASPSLLEAVGDLCSRFYNRRGEPVDFPGSERLMALELPDLQRAPTTIAVATGSEKVISIVVGARAGYFTELVTDPLTGTLLLAAAQREGGTRDTLPKG